MNPQISSKARKRDNKSRSKIATRQECRKFLEQLDDFMLAVSGELTGNLITVHNRTLASK